MKRAFTFLLFYFCAASVYAQDIERLQDAVNSHVGRVEGAEPMFRHAFTDLNGDGYAKEFGFWDKEMNRFYALLIASLSPEQQQAVHATQVAEISRRAKSHIADNNGARNQRRK
jgi:hypothetical protein